MVLGAPGYNHDVRLFAVLALIVLSLILAVFAVPSAQDTADADREMLDGAEAVLAYKPGFSPTDSRELLDEILGRTEYQGEGDTPLEQNSWLTRLLVWLTGLMGVVGLGATGWIGVAAVAMLLTLLLFLVVRLAWMQAGRRGRSTIAKPKAGQLGLDELLQAAGEAVQRGDYRTAVRIRFLALLRQLEVPASTLLTNAQLQRRLGMLIPSAATPFGELVSLYEDTWYGGLDCGKAQHDRALALSERVVDVATRDAHE